MPLQPLADNVWTDHEPMRFFGLPLGRRVTAIRTQAGEVVVFSPLSWSSAHQAELEALGKVSLMVVSSRWHDRYFDQYMGRRKGSGCKCYNRIVPSASASVVFALAGLRLSRMLSEKSDEAQHDPFLFLATNQRRHVLTLD